MAIIKRYSNRKLYDTGAKRYITLQGIADLIRRGEEILVTDHDTGRDITALVQAQTILDLEKKLKGGLPGTLLTHLIRAGSGRLGQFVDALNPDDAAGRTNLEIERRIQALVDRDTLSEEEGVRLLELLLSAGEPNEPAAPVDDAELEKLLQERGVPSRQEFERLVLQIDALSAELERLAPEPRPQAQSRPRRRRRRMS